MELADKNIVITGASKGLGKEIALRLCRRNANLILLARTECLLEKTQQEIEKLSGKKPLVFVCDISDEADVNRVAEEIGKIFGRIDVLINNAGVAVHKNSGEMSNAEMRKQFEVNFFGAFYCIKAFLALLKLGASPYILNVNSLVSKFALADNSIYAATKSALVRFSEGLRMELKEFNIQVGSFFPGLMRTSFQSDREGGYEFPPLITVSPEKAAVKIEHMIVKRKKNAYIRRLMIGFLMTIKKLSGK